LINVFGNADIKEGEEEEEGEVEQESGTRRIVRKNFDVCLVMEKHSSFPKTCSCFIVKSLKS
jgi:hypothetical protein